MITHMMRTLLTTVLSLVCIVTTVAFRRHTVRSNRRLQLSLSNKLPTLESTLADQQYGLGRVAFSLIPLSPESTGKRKTILTEVVKDTIWTLDQLQGIINVNVPVRSTVIKLSDGGLFVYNPVAPTKECMKMIRSLEEKHGKVKFIVLGTLGVEHKGTVGAFAPQCPAATIFIQPDQYSFPINLPSQFFLPFGRNIQFIPKNSIQAPWSKDFDHASLPTLKPRGPGGYGETAFYHKTTGTLLVTDSVIRVDDEPPAIVQDDPRALLYHARDNMFEEVIDTPAVRRRGWRRMALFGLCFQPVDIEILPLGDALAKSKQVPAAMAKLGEGAIPFVPALYPWQWLRSEEPSFKALQGGLLVAPILRQLIFNRDPEIVIAWVKQVCRWPFTRIIPCHFANDIKSSPAAFEAAFDFLYEPQPSLGPFAWLSSKKKESYRCPMPREGDLMVLKQASSALRKAGTLLEEAPLLKRAK